VKLALRIAGLSGSQARLLMRAFLALAWYRLALPFSSLAALHRRSLRIVPRRRALLAPSEVAWAVRPVAHRMPRTHCLPRSLALHSLLRHTGFDSQLRIGVAPAEGGGIAAHAWVECAGEPVGDPPDVATRYAAFDGPIPREAFER
jgi:hypothetical protein